MAQAFISHWISRFGIPAQITTDQGHQLQSKLFAELSKFLGIKRFHTSPYYPQSNGLVERFHRTMTKSLKRFENSNWVNSLSIILLGLGTSWKPDSSYSW